jgi:hypothetical protein
MAAGIGIRHPPQRKFHTIFTGLERLRMEWTPCRPVHIIARLFGLAESSAGGPGAIRRAAYARE